MMRETCEEKSAIGERSASTRTRMSKSHSPLQLMGRSFRTAVRMRRGRERAANEHDHRNSIRMPTQHTDRIRLSPSSVS